MVIIVRKWQKSNFYFDIDLGNSLLATMKIRKEKKKPITHTHNLSWTLQQKALIALPHISGTKGNTHNPLGRGVSNC